MAGAKGGKKGRKIGRNKNKPSMKAYTAVRRWESNKKKRVARHERAVARKRVKLAKRSIRIAKATWAKAQSEASYAVEA